VQFACVSYTLPGVCHARPQPERAEALASVISAQYCRDVLVSLIKYGFIRDLNTMRGLMWLKVASFTCIARCSASAAMIG
jgi:hypothetical protein